MKYLMLVCWAADSMDAQTEPDPWRNGGASLAIVQVADLARGDRRSADGKRGEYRRATV
jgi:hypothetical protein